MKSVFAIPHYCRRDGVGSARYGSQCHGPGQRGNALANTVLGLHQLFGQQQAMIHVGQRKTISANQSLSHSIRVFVVTVGGEHALAEANLPADTYCHVEVTAEPSELGYHCHRVLAEKGRDADYACYMEDDLVIRDAWWFEKLRWFNGHLGNQCLLLPNRYEISASGVYKKCYLDGDLAPSVTAELQNVHEQTHLYGKALGRTVRFSRPLNPHAGCFFLNRGQVEHWTRLPRFGEPNREFIGPLESAATRSLMQAFRVYKPAPENASLLEIEHQGEQFIRKVRGV
jgi:hypothetical protein